MRERILNQWNMVRIVRLLLGAGAVVQGLWLGDIFWAIAGAFLLLSALANYGCCGSAGCPVSYSKTQKDTHANDQELDASK